MKAYELKAQINKIRHCDGLKVYGGGNPSYADVSLMAERTLMKASHKHRIILIRIKGEADKLYKKYLRQRW